MSRIDEIKEHQDESDSYREWFSDGWNRNKGAIDNLINHNRHLSESVQYLLSRLEIAEKALTNIQDMVGEEFGEKTKERCQVALQQIRT